MSNEIKAVRKRGRGRPPKLTPEHLESLRRIANSNPTSSLDELADKLYREVGVRVDGATVRCRLNEMGFVRRVSRPGKGAAAIDQEKAPNESTSEQPASGADAVPPALAADAAPPAPQKKRYGYTEAHRHESPDGRYPSCLTNAEWDLVRDIFETKGPGTPPKYSRRAMVDALCYVVRSGIAWRMMPKEFPHWHVAFVTFRRWSTRGLFEIMHDRLRAQWRAREGRSEEPTAAAIDSQSVKTSPQGGEKGYDAGKKVKGRKRHLLVDTLGLLLVVVVLAADVQDRDAALPVIDAGLAKYPTITKIFADSAYAGRCAKEVHARHPEVEVDVVRHPANRSVGTRSDGNLPVPDLEASRLFVPLPKRWVVERTHAWVERPRRMAKDNDRTTTSSTAWIWFTQARILMRRLTWIQDAELTT